MGSEIILKLCYLQVLHVPDRRPRTGPEVVLVRRWATRGSGNLEGEGLGRKEGQGRSVHKQPGTEVDGSCHSQEGSK